MEASWDIQESQDFDARVRFGVTRLAAIGILYRYCRLPLLGRSGNPLGSRKTFNTYSDMHYIGVPEDAAASAGLFFGAEEAELIPRWQQPLGIFFPEMNTHSSANNSPQQSKAIQSLETWQKFHPLVLAHINYAMTRTAPAMQAVYNKSQREMKPP